MAYQQQEKSDITIHSILFICQFKIPTKQTKSSNAITKDSRKKVPVIKQNKLLYNQSGAHVTIGTITTELLTLH